MSKKRLFVFSAVFLVFLWKILSLAVDSPLVLPPPESVACEFFSLLRQPHFLAAGLFSFLRVLAAFCISAFLGILLGFFSAMIPSFGTLVEIPLAVIRSVPLVSIILVVLFWLGSDSVPVFAAVLLSFPVIFTSAFTGFSFREKRTELACSVFKITAAQRFMFLRLPCAWKFLEDAMVNSCGMIWKAVAAAEVLSVPAFSLGSYLQSAQVVLEMQRVFAVTVFIAALGFVSERLLKIFFLALKKLGKKFTGIYFTADFLDSGIRQDSEKNFLVEIKNLCVDYSGQKIFENYSQLFPQKEVTSVVAPSGSGKTTLLDFIARGFPSVSYAMQTPAVFSSLDVLQNVQLPLLNIFGRKRSRLMSLEILGEFGLGGKENACIEKISGGERQRVSLARAAAFPGGILLLDESFQFLDVSAKRKCMDYMLDCQNKNRRTVIFAANEIREAVLFSDRIILYSAHPMRPLETFAVSDEDRKNPSALERKIAERIFFV
ncbi:ATP-binding cassette domain-containing protein [Treponema sp.]|uniref:ATP-binding cassette domain-containing protein n=1 Tax=Treponema sp. TaxID=166 RepID=UPI003F0C4FB9